MDKLLTIAIPTWNRKAYIDLALKSIFSQYDERVEVIVSDNCSTDGTGDYVKEKYPLVTYYCNEENVGIENFKRCYDRATAKYVMLLGDDDIIVKGCLCYILKFLEENPELTLLFLNHTFFNEEFKGVEQCKKNFFDISIGDFVTKDKVRFMNVARHQLTFISCFILAKSAYLGINSIEKYGRDYFLHTCIVFEATRSNNAELGVISRVCIAQNLQRDKCTDMSVIVEVFGEDGSNVFCNVGVQCGYDKKQMKTIYSNFVCSSWSNIILSYKAKDFEWKEAFWSRGYPVIKRFPKAWITIIPVALTPAWVAKLARKLKRKIKG